MSGSDFLGHELLGGLADQALIVGEFGGSEDVFGARRFEQETAAEEPDAGCRRGGHKSSKIAEGVRANDYETRSKIPAAPMPPPMHMVTIP